ncbi:MAG: lamin tail domain-containing protein [Candidatus Pacebacteria bacterium]|nr:lamin tail domain-containing protein [Candidatus Paceibacterota bacterium]
MSTLTRAIILFSVLGYSQFCFANLVITEIMYDPEGADTKREWIEIMNTGSEAVVVADWHFLENQVHHKLSPQDFQSLEPGERAVVVQDVPTFQQEYSYSQFLIKSSFSLNNTGEELALSNKEKEVVFSILYSSEWGAGGNGMSLQLINDDWGQAYPTPGEENAGEVVSPGDEGGDVEEEDPKTETPKKSVETFAPTLDIPQFFTARSSFPLEAFATHTKDGKKKILNGYYFLNMGDGSFIESSDPLNFAYSYSYPGNYEIILEYYSSKLAFEAGEKPITQLAKKIKVSDSSIEISNVDIETNIHISNSTNTKINLGGWKLFSGDKNFIFPRNTYLEPSGVLVIPFRVHKILLSRERYINLVSNQGITISTFLPFSQQGEPAFATNTVGGGFSSDPLGEPEDDEGPIDATDAYLMQNPDKIRVDFYRGEDQAVSHPEDISETSQKLKIYTVYAAILAIIIVIVRVILRRRFREEKPLEEQEDTVVGDIELLE